MITSLLQSKADNLCIKGGISNTMQSIKIHVKTIRCYDYTHIANGDVKTIIILLLQGLLLPNEL